MLQRRNVAMLQRRNVAVLQRRYAITPQHHNTAKPQNFIAQCATPIQPVRGRASPFASEHPAGRASPFSFERYAGRGGSAVTSVQAEGSATVSREWAKNGR